VKSIWAIPGEVHPANGSLRVWGHRSRCRRGQIDKRLSDTGRDFVFLKRQIPPEVSERVADLHIPGLFQNREYRRYYPSGEVTAHVLGFTGVDDIGQEGVELAFQDGLAGKPGSRRVIKDRLGRRSRTSSRSRPRRTGTTSLLLWMPASRTSLSRS